MMLHTACCSAADCRYNHTMITLYNIYDLMLHTACRNAADCKYNHIPNYVTYYKS